MARLTNAALLGGQRTPLLPSNSICAGRAAIADEQDGEASEALARVAEMEEAEKEARLVALRLRELKAQPFTVWDEKAKSFRPG